jgi:hypothetical protein
VGHVAADGKRSLVIRRHRLMNNIKMAIKEIGCDSDEWIKLAQDSDQSRSLVNMNLFIR